MPALAPVRLRRLRRLRRYATLDPLRRAGRQVRADLRADPYLAPILALAVLLTTFWLHHRLPNFATRDERWRVVDVVEPLGFLVQDPRPVSVREGFVYWRSYGATFYLYGVVLLPSLLLVTLVDTGVFVDIATHPLGEFWRHWLRVPDWVWTALVLPARLVNAAIAVGCVYMAYRLGVELQDRVTGRLAALLTSLTWALLVLAHEAGEDVPALFAFLLSLYFALQYVDSGTRGTLYRASLLGGLAAGLKLSGGISALVIAAALVLRARRSGTSLRTWALDHRRAVATGATLGAAVILASYPSVLLGAPDQLAGRILRGADAKNEPHGWRIAPTWWWVVRGYLNGLGLPLALGSVAGVGVTLRRIRGRPPDADRLALVLVGVAAGLAVVLPWAYVRTHHLLPTMPLLVLLVAAALGRLARRRPRTARTLAAVLVVTSAAYAGTGVLGYASQPRDRATAWLAADAPANATVETYTRDPQDAAVPHGLRVNYPGRDTLDGRTIAAWTLAMPRRCPDYIVLNYQRGLLFLAPENHSKRAETLSYPPVARYFQGLVAGDYPYEVVRRFGPRPRFLDDRPRRPAWRALLRVGVDPRTIQYGDPQDFGVKQYTVVLERTGACRPNGTDERNDVGGRTDATAGRTDATANRRDATIGPHDAAGRASPQATVANSRTVSKAPSAIAAATASVSTSGTTPGYFRPK